MPQVDVASNATPEVALLLALARLELTAKDRDAAHAALKRGVDWNRFVNGAKRHGLLPIVQRHLHGGAFDVPDSTRQRLHQAAAKIARRNLMLSAELASMVRCFEENGIRVVPLKGPVLAQTLYGSVALRRINDLDLLCRREELPRALTLLADRGFTVDYASHGATPEHFSTLAQRLKDIGLWCPDRRYRIELHHALVSDRAGHGAGLDEIGGDLEQVHCLGAPIWTIRAELLLVYLSMHGAGHAWERLEWLCGIGELLRSGAVRDWQHVRARAAKLGALQRVQAALQTAHELLDAPVPSEWMAPRWSTRRAVAIVTRRICADGDGRSEREMLRYSLWTDDSVGARVRRLWELLSLPRAADLRVVKLPRPLWPLYAFLRPVRIVLRTVRGNSGS